LGPSPRFPDESNTTNNIQDLKKGHPMKLLHKPAFFITILTIFVLTGQGPCNKNPAITAVIGDSEMGTTRIHSGIQIQGSNFSTPDVKMVLATNVETNEKVDLTANKTSPNESGKIDVTLPTDFKPGKYTFTVINQNDKAAVSAETQVLQGETGATGPTGPKGPSGPSGAIGPKGDTGEIWQKSGSDIYYTAGKIGAGTASPNEPLTVEGTISVKEQNSVPSTTSGYGKIYAKAPVAGSGNDSYAKLLLHMDGTDGSSTFPDDSSSGHSVTMFGNAQVSTSQKKYGTGSGYFDGNGDYLSIPDSTDWDFGNGDFTIDFWISLSSLADTNNKAIISMQEDRMALGWAIEIDVDILAFLIGSNQYRSNKALIINSWTHVAFVRSGNILKIFQNGIETYSTTIGTIAINGDDKSLVISNFRNTPYNRCLNGYLDEVRISKGIARWTSNFTPPSAPYGGNLGRLYYQDSAGNELLLTTTIQPLPMPTPSADNSLNLLNFEDRLSSMDRDMESIMKVLEEHQKTITEQQRIISEQQQKIMQFQEQLNIPAGRQE
jgi:hypothetical protein